jgi:hypothetical protein
MTTDPFEIRATLIPTIDREESHRDIPYAVWG